MQYTFILRARGLIAITLFSLFTLPALATTQHELAANNLSVHYTSYCLWNASGEALCSGTSAAQAVPEDLFPVAKISSANGINCAVGIAGELRCWGNLGHTINDAPVDETGYLDVAVGDGYACAIRQNGGISCWGRDNNERLDAPAGEFVQLDASDQKTCAVAVGGTVSCWGWNDLGVLDVPAELTDAVKVSVGAGVACALLESGEISCWGRHSVFPDSGPYMDVAVGGARYDYGYSLLCGLTVSGEIDCRLDPGSDLIQPLPDSAEQQAINDIPSGTGYVALEVHTGSPYNSLEGCAITASGVMDCWGINSLVQTLPGEGSLSELIAPDQLQALVYSDTAAELHWEASNTQVIARGQIAGYEILRNGEHHATTSNGNSFIFSDLIPGVEERISVRQLSDTGEAGPLSAVIVIDTANRDVNESGEDNNLAYTPPLRPVQTMGLQATIYGPDTLELFWTRSEHNNLAGYEIRRGSELVGFTTGTSYLDTVPATNQSYRYDVIAVLRNSTLMFGFSSIDVVIGENSQQCE